jgi:MoxR-like ATPase
MMSVKLEVINQLKRQLEQSIIGQKHRVETLLISLLTNDNFLLEVLTGTAKARSIKGF